MIALLLVGFAATLAAAAPRRLVAAGWPYRSPRLAILAWHATTYAVVVALTAAATVALLHWTRGHQLACAAWHVCLDALRGEHGRTGQLFAVAGLALLTMLAARLAIAWRQVIAAGARDRQRHLDLLRLTGTPRPDLDATVLPGPDAAAYLVPGRDPRVVITAGALSRLGGDAAAAPGVPRRPGLRPRQPPGGSVGRAVRRRGRRAPARASSSRPGAGRHGRAHPDA